MNLIFGWIVSHIFGSISNIFKQIFETKRAKLLVWQEGIIGIFLALRQAGINDVAEAQILAQVIIAEADSPHWIVAAWRPVVAIMLACTSVVMLYLAYHGIMPPEMNATQATYFQATLMMVSGYGVLRSADKWVDKIVKSKLSTSILSQLAQKAGFELPTDNSEGNNENSHSMVTPDTTNVESK